MKALRIIMYVLLALIGVLIVLGLVGPKSYDVYRTATIDAPKELVFPYLQSLEKGNEWAPWFEEDPEAAVTYEGPDGQIGSKSSWDGEKIGKGTQIIKSIDPNVSVISDLIFYPPWGETKSAGYFLIEGDGEKCDVTWGFRGDNGFVSRIMSTFMSMEDNTAPMFAKGLENLNTLVKRDMEQEWNGQSVSFRNYGSESYLTSRSEVALDKISDYLASSYGPIIGAVAANGATMAGQPCAMYFSWDPEGNKTDMAAAIRTEEAIEVENFQLVDIPAGKRVAIDFYGPYEDLGKAHDAADAYAAHFGLELDQPAMEEYITDPTTEPDNSKWLTKVSYRVTQK